MMSDIIRIRYLPSSNYIVMILYPATFEVLVFLAAAGQLPGRISPQYNESLVESGLLSIEVHYIGIMQTCRSRFVFHLALDDRESGNGGRTKQLRYGGR